MSKEEIVYALLKKIFSLEAKLKRIYKEADAIYKKSGELVDIRNNAIDIMHDIDTDTIDDE